MINWCEKHAVDLPNKADIEHLYKVKSDPVTAANALRRYMGARLGPMAAIVRAGEWEALRDALAERGIAAEIVQ